MAFAMDLTPLVEDPALDIAEYVRAFIDRFAAETMDRLSRLL
jgi:hypothetical protein